MSRQWDRLIKQDGSATFARFLDTNGDGTGDAQVLGDYTIAEHEIFLEPDITIAECHISRLIVLIRTGGVIRAERYGSLPVLPSGIRVTVNDGPGGINERFDAMAGIPVKDNGSWAAMASEVTEHSFGSGDSFVSIRWEVGSEASPIILLPGMRMSVRFNDSFIGLVSHTFHVQGTTFPA